MSGGGPLRLRIMAALLFLVAWVTGAEAAEPDPHAGHRMQQAASGMVMNANDSVLPRDCSSISRDYDFEVRAGAAHSDRAPGTIFGYSQHEFSVEPCSRVTVTLVNEDDVRHQWMVHGLPRYLYPEGMFHIEAAGGQSQTGTFILPSDHATYLVHCDIAQHMEKGMKGQLKAGRGSGDLQSIPGLSASPSRDAYLPDNARYVLLLSGLAGAAFAWLLLRSGNSGR